MSDYYDNLKVFDELKIKPRLGIFSEQECVLCEEIRKQGATIAAQQRVLNGLAEMLGVAEGDVDGLIEAVERLKKAAMDLIAALPCAGCEDFHHAKRDQHLPNEACPPLERCIEAISKLAALAGGEAGNG